MPEQPKAYRDDEPFVFVSYAHADAELADPLIAGLQERGLRIWFDDRMEAGDLWEDVIPDLVEQCAAMLCLVSAHYTDSGNCLDEISYAKDLKKELLILHLENKELPRNFRFRYGRFHALWLSDYPDRSSLLDKLSATPKLRCCVGDGTDTSTAESPEALYKKGEACYYGNGVRQSYEEAVKWFQKAAARGHREAMRALGYCYGQGHGVVQSSEKKAMWYRRAADDGDAAAMHNLGCCYYAGEGVHRSYKEAAMWYRRAAEKGDADAMNSLSYCYTCGRGVVKSQKLADYWRNRAKQAMHDASR